MPKTIQIQVPDQVAADYLAKYGTGALALAYIKSLIIQDYNAMKDAQADAAANAARLAPTKVTPADLPGGGIA